MESERFNHKEELFQNRVDEFSRMDVDELGQGREKLIDRLEEVRELLQNKEADLLNADDESREILNLEIKQKQLVADDLELNLRALDGVITSKVDRGG